MNVKKLLIIAACLSLGLAGAVLFAVTRPKEDKEPTPNELLGLTLLEAGNVEKIHFLKPREMQYTWETSDPEIIFEIIDHFNRIEFDPEPGGGVDGAFLILTFNLIRPVNGLDSVRVGLYGYGLVNAELYSYEGSTFKVIKNGKRDNEWDAILERCEQTWSD